MSQSVTPAGKAGDKQEFFASVNSAETSVSYNTNLTLLIKHIEASSQYRHASSQTRTTMTGLLVNGVPIDKYLLDLDASIIQTVATGAFDDLEILEKLAPAHRDRYGREIKLHLLRKRLWRMCLTHVLIREKNSARKHYLHPKWEARIREALK